MDFEKLKSFAIGFSAISSDERASRAYKHALYSEKGVAWRISPSFIKGKYGTAFNLLLITFYIEGEHKWFTMPTTRKLGRYAPKDKSIEFSVPILEPELKQLEGEQSGRDALLVNILNSLIEALEKRKFPEGFDFDRELFISDLRLVISSYETS